MTDKLYIRRADGLWVVRAAGAVIAESRNARELSDGDAPPVIFFPREDVAMAFLEVTGRETHSPVLGTARYFSLSSTAEHVENAAWSFEDPAPEAADITGHIAFDSAAVAVEQL